MKIGSIAFEKSVGGVVFRREGDKVFFLLLHYISGHWDFPKGHVEKGEKDYETLRREIEEETGIKNININKFFKKSIYYKYKPKGKEKKSKKGINLIVKKVVYYICETREQKVTLSHEHKGYKWSDFEGAAHAITHENGKKILFEADHFLEIGRKERP